MVSLCLPFCKTLLHLEYQKQLLWLQVVSDNAAMEAKPIKDDLPKRKRRWFQFSLRSLMIVFTLFALWLAWLANRAHRQRTAVAAVMELGGTVSYDYQISQDEYGRFLYDPKATPGWPQWAIDTLGIDCFQNAVTVSLMNGRATDETLLLLGRVPTIKSIAIKGGNVTNDGVSHLSDLPDLELLGLWQTSVGNGGLESLAHHKHLKNLVLDETNVTDDDLVFLRGLTEMKVWLGLTDTKITDVGVESLTGMKNLQSLNLERTKVSRKGLRMLRAALPNTQISPFP